MAKKKTKQQKQGPVSPEKYLRTKARTLPVDKCYVNSNWQEAGMAYVCVLRRHTQGTHSFGMFLVDTWCRGVYDCFYGVNADDERIEYIMDRLSDLDMVEVDYALAHNIVYGAIEFADDAGIDPHPDFNIARYMLDEDNDDIYMELQFGKDGKYCLAMPDRKSANRYLKLLDKNIGPGNYDYILEYDESDYDESEDDEPEWHGKLNPGVTGTYAYLRPERPNADISTLYDESLPEILSADIGSIDDYTVNEILAHDPDELRNDLHKIIISTIYDTWKCIDDDDDCIEGMDYNLLPNALVFLAEVADESSAEVVFEVLRQSDPFSEFYFGDIQDEYLSPVVFRLFGRNLDRAADFMKERGPDGLAKAVFLEVLTDEIMINSPDMADSLKRLYADLFEFYLENKDDEYLWDGNLVGIMVSRAKDCGFIDLLPQITRLYETGMVDEGACGPISKVKARFTDKVSDYMSAFPVDIFEWLNKYRSYGD